MARLSWILIAVQAAATAYGFWERNQWVVALVLAFLAVVAGLAAITPETKTWLIYVDAAGDVHLADDALARAVAERARVFVFAHGGRKIVLLIHPRALRRLGEFPQEKAHPNPMTESTEKEERQWVV